MRNSWWDRGLVLGNWNSGWGTANGTGGYLVLGNWNSGWGTAGRTGDYLVLGNGNNGWGTEWDKCQ